MAAIKPIRNIRKFDTRVDKPRPLKSVSSIESDPSVLKEATSSDYEKHLSAEEVLKELDFLNVAITNGNFDLNTNSLIMRISTPLKHCGQQLELKFKDQLDRYFETLRNTSRLEEIGLQARAIILEIIELRANNWRMSEVSSSYYNHKLTESPVNPMNTAHMGGLTLMNSATLPANFTPGHPYTSPSHIIPHSNTQVLTSGEVIKNSGKFPHPTKIPGKNFYKDEVVIRNSDSGKVSPGARDRLVQITGPCDDSIDRAKVLIEETIRRNASPIREPMEMGLVTRLGSESSTSLNSTTSEESIGNSSPHLPPGSVLFTIPVAENNYIMTNHQPTIQTLKPINNKLVHSHSMGDAKLSEYNNSLSIGHDLIRLSGSNVDLINTAKIVLEQYFAGQAKLEEQAEEAKCVIPKQPLPQPVTYNLRRSHSQPQSSLKSPTTTTPGIYQFGSVQPQSSFAFKPVIRQGSSSNGQPTSSSEEDTTLKAGENSPATEEEENANRVGQAQHNKVEPPRGFSLIRMKSTPVTESELASVVEESPKEQKNILKYSREFLLECSKKPICKQDPKDAKIVAERAPLIVKRLQSEIVPTGLENSQ